MGKRSVALHHASHSSLPIMAGYSFLGLTYGIYMHELGFSFLYPMLLAITIYAGSAEFLLGNMLLGSFHPLQAFLMVLMVNARHLFYGLSMLDRYKGLGWKKFFLVFGMSDETFALTSSAKVPEGVDRGWFLLWITWLDETYWVVGATVGGLLDLILPLISRAWTLCLPPYFPTTGFEKKTIQAVFPDLSSLGSAFLLLVPTISSYRA